MIYISGAISSLPEKKWKDNFNKVEKKLRQLFPDDLITNPTKLIPYQGKNTWRGYMRTDISQLALCDEIWVMPNWWRSKGCVVEIIVSLILGVRVLLVPRRWLK